MSQLGVFESTFTATTEAQKDQLLTKIKIVYAANVTDDHVNVWVKNIGTNPIVDANKTDVYFGEVNAVDVAALNTKVQLDGTWFYDGPLPQPIWQKSETYSINITDTDLIPQTTYLVSITTPNGVTDEFIFATSGR
jgi:flagellar protein FlaG